MLDEPIKMVPKTSYHHRGVKAMQIEIHVLSLDAWTGPSSQWAILLIIQKKKNNVTLVFRYDHSHVIINLRINKTSYWFRSLINLIFRLKLCLFKYFDRGP